MYKSLSLVFTVSLLLTTLMSYGQDDDGDSSLSRFSLIGYGGIGFAKVENDEQANYNLDANTGELLFLITDWVSLLVLPPVLV